jgi:hypothetical protein
MQRNLRVVAASYSVLEAWKPKPFVLCAAIMFRARAPTPAYLIVINPEIQPTEHSSFETILSCRPDSSLRADFSAVGTCTAVPLKCG